MKLFSQFLSESARTYDYTIKFSFKPDSMLLDKIEQALGKYNLVDISAPKSQPITRVDKDFPTMKNPEVYSIDIKTDYPASNNMILTTIKNMGMELQDIAVVSTSHTASIDKEESEIEKNTSDKALLDQDYQKQDNKKISDENFGIAYNEKLIKNSLGSTDQIIPKELKKTKGKTLNDPEFKIGNKSAMGSVKPTLPTPKSFAR